MRTGYNLIAITVLSILIFSGCDEETVIPLVDETNNGFQKKEVAEIFAQNCLDAGCHGNSEPHHELKLTSFSEMTKGSISIPTGSPPDANLMPIPKDTAELGMDAAECIGCGA